MDASANLPEAPGLDHRYIAAHMASLGSEGRVVVERTLRRPDGEVVAERGAAFGPDLATRLNGAPLVEPLHACVAVSDPIDADVVVNVWSRVRANHDDLDQLERRLGVADDFEMMARSTPIPASIWQILTVLFEQRPDWFNLAVSGAWWAVALAREVGMVEVDVMRAFAAALTRDVGFLFMDARHIDRPGYLEGGTKAWCAVQDHVRTGERLWLESDAIPAWAAAVGRAVVEHHERINGTGYPDRPLAEELDPVGQLVGMSDVLTAVRLRRFGDSGHNVRDMVPLLMVSSDCFSRPVTDAAVRLLSRSGLRSTTVTQHGSKADLLDQLLSRAYLLRRLTQVLRDLPSFEPVTTRGQAPAPPLPLTRAVRSTVQMLERSGVAQTELGTWLDNVRNGKSTARMHELCEMDLQQGEAIWRVEQVRRLLAEHVEAENYRPNSPVFGVLHALQNPLSL